MKPSVHEVLAHLAGQVPDDLLELARDRWADGDLAEVGRLLRFGRAAYRCTVPPDCYDAVRTVLRVEEDVAGLVFPRTPVPPFDFLAVAPETKAVVGGALDLVAGPERARADVLCDDTDRVLVAGASAIGGVRGLWRTWRLGPASWPPPTRIVLAEVERHVDPTAVRRRLGMVCPGAIVEVLVVGARVPEYHVRARAASALLWAAVERPLPMVAPPLHEITHPHPVIDGVRSRFRRFLEAGVDLMALPGWRTDGVWAWPATYTDHLDRCGEAPHRPLLCHAEHPGRRAGEVDSIAEHQAIARVTARTG